MKNTKKFALVVAFLGILIVPSFTSAATVEELQTQISALLVQLQSLQSQLAQIQGTTQTWCHNFNVNLKVGDQGDEIQALEHVLVAEGFSVTEHSSNFPAVFDEKMAAAVSGFQQKYADEILTPLGLKYGTGFVGPSTRAKLNALYGCVVTKPKPVLPPSIPILPPSITVLSPNGGEKWEVGTTQHIKFSSNLPSEPVDIWLFNPNASLHQKIATTITNPIINSPVVYEWKIPDSIQISSAYKIQTVTNLNGKYGVSKIEDFSDAPFSIVAAGTPSITVLSPNGGESWTIGLGAYTVRWTSMNIPATNLVSIGLRNTSTGVDYSLIGDSPNDGIEGVSIPSNIPAGTYWLFVKTLVNNQSIIDWSDAPLSIITAAGTPSITVLSPNGGEKWQLGNTHTILWTPYSYNPDINPSYQVTAYLEKLVNGNFVTVGKIVECGKASIHWDGNLNTCGSNTYAEPGDYYVRVVNNTTGASDRSDKPFTLIPKGTLKADLKINGSDGPITIPEGGATYTISWTSNTEKCSIYFHNSDPHPRQENLAPSGSMSMKLLPNTNWYIDGISLACSSQTPIEGGASDYVQILPLNTSVTVVSPNGGEAIDFKSYYTIKWKAFANLTKVSIALYKNDASYAWIVRDLPTSNALEGSYNWLPSNIVISESDFGKNIFKIYILGYKQEGGTVEDKSDAAFSIVAATTTPSITVLSPNGGESLPINSTQPVLWKSNGIPSTNLVKIVARYYTDNVPYSNNYNDYTLVETVNDGSEVVNLSGLPAGIYTINIKTSYNNVFYYDWSDSYFKIVSSTTTPSITVVSPNGGEKWEIGSVQKISWQTQNIFSPNDKISIYIAPAEDLSKNINLAQEIPNTGYYNYTVDDPAKFSYRSPLFKTGGQFKIFVCAKAVDSNDLCSYAIDYSDAPFSIVAATTTPSITVLSPNGGEKWVLGSKQYIKFQSNNVGKSVCLHLYRNNVYLQNIGCTVNATDSGVTYEWLVPSNLAIGDGYKIFANTIDANGKEIYDYSDAPFSIVAVGTTSQSDTLNQMANVLESARQILEKISTALWR
jgi:hypothetical protein